MEERDDGILIEDTSPRRARGADVALLGEHPLIRKINALVAKIAPTDARVLITGESGTGKELVARAIHALSPRARHPFVAVNCGAIPPDLLDSEMFGHERGAFTDATSGRPGLFKIADGGTIFLDEIGEMSPPLQVKLLRVLQESEIRPVGSERTIRVDVRVVAATNRDLAAEVGRGGFREDLFYRLQVIPIWVPPLRARRSDVPFLAMHFLTKQNGKRPAEDAVGISDDATSILWEYDWPGNVRELENLIERMVTLADGREIDVDDVPAAVRTAISQKKVVPPAPTPDDAINLGQAVEAFEFGLIDQALRRTRGNKQAAARLLKLRRTTLMAKLARRKGVVVDGDGASSDPYARATYSA